jgi:hypothetical protein
MTQPRAARIATLISILLIPPTVSTGVFTALVLTGESGTAGHRALVWLVAVLCSGVLQMLYVLWLKRGSRVTAYDVPERLQRSGPYLLSAVLSFLGLAALIALGAAWPVRALMWCFAWNTVILYAVNRRWKISAHLMGFTGPLLLLAPLCRWSLALAILPALVLGWARVRSGTHTPAQVLAGAAAGIALTLAQLWLLHAVDLPGMAPPALPASIAARRAAAYSPMDVPFHFSPDLA